LKDLAPEREEPKWVIKNLKKKKKKKKTRRSITSGGKALAIDSISS